VSSYCDGELTAEIVPSSARSTSSAAIQLPNQLVPLLSNDLERLKSAIDLALPRVKKRTALEEAEFEDDDGDSFEKEMMLQCRYPTPHSTY
jgi:hypothetical protein